MFIWLLVYYLYGNLQGAASIPAVCCYMNAVLTFVVHKDVCLQQSVFKILN